MILSSACPPWRADQQALLETVVKSRQLHNAPGHDRWLAARFPAAMPEHELAEPYRWRIGSSERGPTSPAKTLDSFNFDAVPRIPKLGRTGFTPLTII